MNRSRLDILNERKQDLKDITNEKLKKLEQFYQMADLIKLNEDTKHFFQLAYDLYGRDIIDRIRKSTNQTQSEKDNLIGKFDLLHQLIIPFINNNNSN